jgi:hypothetical protein
MESRWFRFWYGWLLLASVLFAGLGLLLAALPDSLLLASWDRALAAAFYGGAVPPEAALMKSFLFGPLGGTIAGFYVMQVFVVTCAFRRGQRWARSAIAAGTAAWFVVDSLASLAHGAWFNLYLVNLPAAAVIAVPLAATWRFFPVRAPRG